MRLTRPPVYRWKAVKITITPAHVADEQKTSLFRQITDRRLVAPVPSFHVAYADIPQRYRPLSEC
jgi:hypothetical protein